MEDVIFAWYAELMDVVQGRISTVFLPCQAFINLDENWIGYKTSPQIWWEHAGSATKASLRGHNVTCRCTECRRNGLPRKRSAFVETIIPWTIQWKLPSAMYTSGTMDQASLIGTHFYASSMYDVARRQLRWIVILWCDHNDACSRTEEHFIWQSRAKHLTLCVHGFFEEDFIAFKLSLWFSFDPRTKDLLNIAWCASDANFMWRHISTSIQQWAKSTILVHKIRPAFPVCPDFLLSLPRRKPWT